MHVYYFILTLVGGMPVEAPLCPSMQLHEAMAEEFERACIAPRDETLRAAFWAGQSDVFTSARPVLPDGEYAIVWEVGATYGPYRVFGEWGEVTTE